AVETVLGFAANDSRLLLLFLAALGGLSLAMATVVRPNLTVLALLFLLYARLSDVYGPSGGLLTVNQALVALFLGSMLAQRLVVRREGLVIDRQLGWMLLFGGAIAVSALA